MTKIINYNGKTYKIIALTEINENKSCIAEFLYKDKWHEVKNYNILFELRKIFDGVK